jgi:hypothetical protein
MPYVVNSEPMRVSVKEKASKYRELLQSYQLPLVVCVIPDFSSGRGLEELESAVFGERFYRFFRRPDGGSRPIPCRNNNGLFAKYPTLSAVTLGVQVNGIIAHTVIRNENATYPLDDRAFPSAPSTAL